MKRGICTLCTKTQEEIYDFDEKVKVYQNLLHSFAACAIVKSQGHWKRYRYRYQRNFKC